MTADLITPTLTDADRRLAAEVAEVVARPRVEAADSFVLHAPLEVLARVELLGRMHPDHRGTARARLAEIATQYEAFGPAAVDVEPHHGDASSAMRELMVAVEHGDVERADAAAQALAAQCSAGQLVELLAEPVAPMLTAAGHGPIFLHLLPRLSDGRDPLASMLRPLARELVRYGDLRLEWIDRVPLAAGSPDQLWRALDTVPALGLEGQGFIYPTMHRIDGDSFDSSIASRAVASLVGGQSIEARARVLQRVAAWSMVREPNEHAPYGWTHCLTMAQAVLGTAHAFVDPSRALAIAASHVVGFRTSMATVPSHGTPPADPDVDITEALGGLDGDPAPAGAAAFHLPVDRRPWLWAELAGQASAHQDAHLVKYTVACGDAARSDPEAEPLYLAAATTLLAWWQIADRA